MAWVVPVGMAAYEIYKGLTDKSGGSPSSGAGSDAALQAAQAQKIALMQQALKMTSAYRPQIAGARQNAMNNRLTAYGGAANALATMYGPGAGPRTNYPSYVAPRDPNGMVQGITPNRNILSTSIPQGGNPAYVAPRDPNGIVQGIAPNQGVLNPQPGTGANPVFVPPPNPVGMTPAGGVNDSRFRSGSLGLPAGSQNQSDFNAAAANVGGGLSGLQGYLDALRAPSMVGRLNLGSMVTPGTVAPNAGILGGGPGPASVPASSTGGLKRL